MRHGARGEERRRLMHGELVALGSGRRSTWAPTVDEKLQFFGELRYIAGRARLSPGGLRTNFERSSVPGRTIRMRPLRRDRRHLRRDNGSDRAKSLSRKRGSPMSKSRRAISRRRRAAIVLAQLHRVAAAQRAAGELLDAEPWLKVLANILHQRPPVPSASAVGGARLRRRISHPEQPAYLRSAMRA